MAIKFRLSFPASWSQMTWIRLYAPVELFGKKYRFAWAQVKAFGALVVLTIRLKNCLSHFFSSNSYVSQIVRKKALRKHTGMIQTPPVIGDTIYLPKILPFWQIEEFISVQSGSCKHESNARCAVISRYLAEFGVHLADRIRLYHIAKYRGPSGQR